MPESRDRLTARKVRVEDIQSGDYRSQEGFDPNYLITPYGLRVSRARVIGTVVDTFVNDDESYGAITLDDGSGTLRAKFFQDLEDMAGIAVGDILEVIGKVKEYDGERYIDPEMLEERTPEHELLRALELEEVRTEWMEHMDAAEAMEEDGNGEDHILQELQGRGLNEVEARAVVDAVGQDEMRSPDDGSESAEEQSGDGQEDVRQQVVAAIETLGEGDGVEYGDIREETGLDEEELEDVINDLLSDGTCYEPRPGKIKKL